MQGNFVTNYLRGSVTGALKRITSTGLNIASQGYIKAIELWRAATLEQQSINADLINCLVSYPELLGDEIVTVVNNFDSDSDLEHINSISSEMGENFNKTLESMQSFANTCTNIPSGNGVTITDANGYIYTLLPDVKCGDVVGIATTYNPRDFRDYLIYKDSQNNWYCNTILKSVGFYREGDVFPIPLTCLTRILGIGDYTEFTSSSTNIFGTLRDFALSLNIDITGVENISQLTYAICLKYNLSYENVLFNDLLTIYNHVKSMWSPVRTGVKTYVGDLIKSLTDSSEYADLLLSISQIIIQGEVTIDKITATLSRWNNSVNRTIKDFVHGAQDAFVSGGFYGLIMWFISIIKGESSISVTDGKLEFTDNKSFIPKQYIASAISTVVGAVGSVVSMALSIMSPVLSVLGAVATSIFGAIPLAWNYDYETNTFASINTSDAYKLNVCPFSILQIECLKTDLDENSVLIDDILNQTGSIIGFEVPGGIIFVGNSDNPDNYRMEFHPSALKLSPKTFTGAQFEMYLDSQSVLTEEVFRLLWNPWKLFPNRYQSIEELWNNACSIADGFTNNNKDGYNVLSEEDDIYLRHCVCFSISLFWMWLSLASGVFATQFYNISQDDMYGNIVAQTVAGIPTRHYNVEFDWFTNMLVSSIWHIRYWNGPTLLGVLPPTWAEIIKMCSDQITNNNLTSHFEATWFTKDSTWWIDSGRVNSFNVPKINLRMVGAIKRNEFYGEALPIPNTFQYLIKVPKYDRNSFILWCAITTLVVAAATTVAIVGALKFKKWRQNKRAKLTSKVANDWDSYQKSMGNYDPNNPQDRPEYHTDEYRKQAYKSYYKSVKKNNLWAAITGGTKYSTAGYWDSDASGDVTPAADTIPTLINSNQYSESIDDVIPAQELHASDSDYYNASTIVRLIKGDL